MALLAVLGCSSPPSEFPADAAPRGERFNVLLISLDTTRADRIGAYGQTEGATPHIDALAAEGTLFEQCVSPVPITLPSHASVMTAVDPFVHGVRYNGFPLDGRLPTLAERLRDAGYATAAEVGGYVLNREYGLHRGFEAYRGVDPPRLERPANEVVDAAIERLRGAGEADRPFFLFVHLFDPHEPYAAPAPWAGRFSSAYLDEIAWTDAQLGRLIEALEATGARERTLVALIGDHGESLGEHGEDTHSFFVYDATIAVPLILSAPGRIPAALRVRPQARLIDLAPTILAFVGVEPLNGVQGLDLRPALDDPPLELVLPAYSETFYPRYSFGYSPLRALRTGGWKYVHAPGPELYRLEDDPGEQRNLAADEPERTERMRAALRRWIEQAPGRDAAAAAAPQEIDAEQLERLQSLGYIGGSTASLVTDDELELFEPDGADPKDRVELMNLSSRAVILDRDGRRDEAEALLREVIELAPDGGAELAAVHGLLGAILAASGRSEEAVGHFRARLASGWSPGDTRTRLAAALVALSRHDEAIRELDAAIAEEAATPATYLHYGSALLGLGRPEQAIGRFRRVLELDPDHPTAAVRLGEALSAAGRAGEAETVYRAAIERRPDHFEPRRALAEALIAGRRAEEALGHYVTLAERDPDDARVQRGLGLAFLQLERPADALEPLRRASELDPASPRAWYSLSAAQAALGRLERAAVSAERAAVAADAAGDPAFAARIRARATELRRAATR